MSIKIDEIILNENDAAFLKSQNVIEQIQTCLLNMSHSKPDDPIDYLINFFSNGESKLLTLAQMEKELMLVDFRNPTFIMSLFNLYDKIKRFGNYRDPRKGMNQVLGEIIIDLLNHLLKNTCEKESFLAHISISPKKHCSFYQFRYIIIATLSFKEYMDLATKAFVTITQSKKSKLKSERMSYKAVLIRLSKWLDIYYSNNDHERKSIMNGKFIKQYPDDINISKEIFEKEAALIFLNQI